MDLSALLQAMTQQTGQPESPLFAPSMPFQQQAPPPMPPMPQDMPVASGLPMGPPPPMPPPPQQAPDNPLGFQPVANDWKAQLPQLLMAIAGLGAAGNNPLGAGAYMHGFQQTKNDQETRAIEAHKQAVIEKRLRDEDEIRRQQIAEAHNDRVANSEETKRQHRASFIADVLKHASELDDPEQVTAYLKGMQGIGNEFGVNTTALPIMANPAAVKRTQTAINDAFTAMVKQHGDKVYEPGFGENISMDIGGRPVSGADLLRRQTVLTRENGKVTPPPPDVPAGAEGADLRDRYEKFKAADPKGRWPNATERTAIRDEMRKDKAIAIHIASGGKGSDEPTKGERLIARAIKEGRQLPDKKGLYKHGYGVSVALEEMGVDVSQLALEYEDVRNTIKTKDSTKFATQRNAVTFVQHQLPLLQKAVKDWSVYATQYPDINARTMDLAKRGMSLPAQRAALALQRVIGDMSLELANIYAGGNAATDKQLAEAHTNIQTDWSPEALQDAVDFISRNAAFRSQILREMGPSIEGNRYTPHGLTGKDTPPPGATDTGTLDYGEFTVRQKSP